MQHQLIVQLHLSTLVSQHLLTVLSFSTYQLTYLIRSFKAPKLKLLNFPPHLLWFDTQMD